MFNVIVAPVSTISRWRKEAMFGTSIISDNGQPLLTENIFQNPPPPPPRPGLLIFRLSVGHPQLFGTGEYVLGVSIHFVKIATKLDPNLP